MDIYSFPPIAAVLDAAYAALTSLAALLDPLVGATASALAIVIVTLLVRSVLVPLGVMQVRAELTRRRLAPKLRELQRRHKKNPEVLQRKMMELYRDEKSSPFAGMLPALAQAPVLSILYGVFVLPNINGHGNALLDETLAGVPLGRSFFSLVGDAAWLDAGIVAILLVLIAVTATLSRRQVLRNAEPLVPGDAQSETQHRMLRIMSWMSFLTLIFAAIVPLAATIYLTVTTAWTLTERTILRARMLRTAEQGPASPPRAAPAS